MAKKIVKPIIVKKVSCLDCLYKCDSDVHEILIWCTKIKMPTTKNDLKTCIKYEIKP